MASGFKYTILVSEHDPKSRTRVIQHCTKLWRILLGWDDRGCVHGGERIAKIKRWKTHPWDLQYGSWSSGSSTSLYDSSSSWRDS